MRRPSHNPRRYRTTTDPTWRGIIATTLVVLAVPVALWVASNPLAGGAALGAGAGFAVAVRRAVRLGRCLADCGGVAVDLVGDRRVCITRRDAAGGC